MNGIFSVLASATTAASKTARAAARAFFRLIKFIVEYFADLVRSNWRFFELLVVVLAAGAAIGVASVTIFLEDDDASRPYGFLLPAGTSTATRTATAGPSARPATTTSARTPSPPATPTPRIITYRGEIDVSEVRAKGLIIGEHSIEILVFEETAVVLGSYSLTMEQFPIGSLLAAIFDSGDDPRWAQFKTCTVRLLMPATLSGTYDRAAGSLAGEALVVPQAEDPTGCLATRPSNVTLDSVVGESATVPWRATLAGRTAIGTIALEPPMPFTATAEN